MLESDRLSQAFHRWIHTMASDSPETHGFSQKQKTSWGRVVASSAAIGVIVWLGSEVILRERIPSLTAITVCLLIVIFTVSFLLASEQQNRRVAKVAAAVSVVVASAVQSAAMLRAPSTDEDTGNRDVPTRPPLQSQAVIGTVQLSSTPMDASASPTETPRRKEKAEVAPEDEVSVGLLPVVAAGDLESSPYRDEVISALVDQLTTLNPMIRYPRSSVIHISASFVRASDLLGGVAAGSGSLRWQIIARDNRILFRGAVSDARGSGIDDASARRAAVQDAARRAVQQLISFQGKSR